MAEQGHTSVPEQKHEKGRRQNPVEPASQAQQQTEIPVVSSRNTADPRLMSPENLLPLQHMIGQRAVDFLKGKMQEDVNLIQGRLRTLTPPSRRDRERANRTVYRSVLSFTFSPSIISSISPVSSVRRVLIPSSS